VEPRRSVTGRRRQWDLRLPDDVRMVALGFSRDPNPKTTVLLFWPGAATPWAAVKLPATTEAAVAIARERAFLQEVHNRFHAALPTVPRVLTESAIGLPQGALLMQALCGVPLSTLYRWPRHTRRRATVCADLDAVSQWLRDLQLATCAGHGAVELCDQVLSGLERRFDGDTLARRSLQVLTPIAAVFRRFHGPKTVVHGDLWLGNVLMDHDEVAGVIDWECGQLVGEPLRDVARFALTYALYLDRQTPVGRRVRGHGFASGEWGAGVRYALTGCGWFPDLVKTFVASAMDRLGADPAYWRELLLIGLADVAVSADDPTWARHHLELLGAVARALSSGAPR
jgi:aminoglycoside phosphotransferase